MYDRMLKALESKAGSEAWRALLRDAVRLPADEAEELAHRALVEHELRAGSAMRQTRLRVLARRIWRACNLPGLVDDADRAREAVRRASSEPPRLWRSIGGTWTYVGAETESTAML